MGLLKEFKEFAIKGNMIDMAVGIIIGTAFNKVVDVLVKQVVLPPLTMMTDGINFENRKLILRNAIPPAEGGTGVEEVAIGYGALLESLIDFVIIGFTIFMVVRLMNRFRKRAENPKDKAVETPKNIELLSSLNDLIEEQNKLIREGKRKE